MQSNISIKTVSYRSMDCKEHIGAKGIFFELPYHDNLLDKSLQNIKAVFWGLRQRVAEHLSSFRGGVTEILFISMNTFLT